MNIEVNEHPLVTFALFAYNQQSYIREAVEGAFSQTYSPLEIILTDDCSTDNTFSIMQETVASYKGPHNVQLKRPAANRGLSAQIDAAVKMAKTEWLVVAAGDDISLPDRVTQHMAIARTHPDAHSTFLAPLPFGGTVACRVTGLSNRVIRFPDTLAKHGGGGPGATHAFRPRIWRFFGELGSGIISEDWVIPFRSSILGSVVWSEIPGVRYRIHQNSVTASYWEKSEDGLPSRRQILMETNALEAFQRDLQTAVVNGLVQAGAGEFGQSWLRKALYTNKVMLEAREAKRLSDWYMSAAKLLLSKNFVGNYRRRISLVWKTLFNMSNFTNIL